EAQQLVVTKARQSRTNPDEYEKQEERLGGKPEQRHERALKSRNQEQPGQAEKYDAENGQSNSIERPRRVQPVIKTDRAGDEENQRCNEIRSTGGRKERLPPT